jgi:hypothetical protein
MYWFAQEMASSRAPHLSKAMEERMGADPHLVDGLMRVLNHELPPSKVFTARVAAPVIAKAFATGRGRRRAMLRELRELAVDEVRHRSPPRIDASPR